MKLHLFVPGFDKGWKMSDEFKIHLSVSGVDQVNEEVGCLEVRFLFCEPRRFSLDLS